MTPRAPHTASFEAVRPRLFGIAYRTLESAADADDVVQDTWIRWQGTDRNNVRDAAAFLATTTKRLALNVAQSARVRRETSVDPWDREPVDVHADPTLGAERREALELALRRLGEAVSQRTGCLRAARGVRLPIPADRRRARAERGEARQLVTRARLRLASEPAGGPAPPSTGGLSTRSSTPHRPEISQPSNSSSLLMSSGALRSPSRPSPDMDSFIDDPLGLDPLGPLRSRDPRWFVPAHAAWNSRTANLSVGPTARVTPVGRTGHATGDLPGRDAPRAPAALPP